MDIRFTSLYQIDHSSDAVNQIHINEDSPNVSKYIKKLVEEISDSHNGRSFLFKSETVEIRTAINKLLNDEYEEGASLIAKKLLEVEKLAQVKIAQLNVEIQRGSLFQTIIRQSSGHDYIIISKADHNEYLDETDFELHMGLPWKKRIYKAFMAKIEVDKSLGSISILDTNSSLSRYWWDDFLDLKESHTDSHNTSTSLGMLDMKVFNPIKVDFRSDYTILRNSSVGYFRSHDDFDLTNYINEIFVGYDPVDSAFPLNKCIEKIKELPTKYNFDSRFTISKKDIQKRIIRKIELTDYIQLILSDYIPDGMITSVQNDAGEKCIQIVTSEGYETFRKK